MTLTGWIEEVFIFELISISIKDDKKHEMNGSAANGKAEGPVQEKEHKSVGNINVSVYLAYFRNSNKTCLYRSIIRLNGCVVT